VTDAPPPDPDAVRRAVVAFRTRDPMATWRGDPEIRDEARRLSVGINDIWREHERIVTAATTRGAISMGASRPPRKDLDDLIDEVVEKGASSGSDSDDD
jgi:hypothetical protein